MHISFMKTNMYCLQQWIIYAKNILSVYIFHSIPPNHNKCNLIARIFISNTTITINLRLNTLLHIPYLCYVYLEIYRYIVTM